MFFRFATLLGTSVKENFWSCCKLPFYGLQDGLLVLWCVNSFTAWALRNAKRWETQKSKTRRDKCGKGRSGVLLCKIWMHEKQFVAQRMLSNQGSLHGGLTEVLSNGDMLEHNFIINKPVSVSALGNIFLTAKSIPLINCNLYIWMFAEYVNMLLWLVP